MMMSVPSEESYVLKRVLRGFRSLRSLILWRVCDDAMLQILGVTCHHLESIGGRGGVLAGLPLQCLLLQISGNPPTRRMPV